MTDRDEYDELTRDMRKDDQLLDDPRWRHYKGDAIRLSPYDQFLIVGAVRYARGRATYIVVKTVDWVIHPWDQLSDNTRHVIARDVQEECDYRKVTPRSVLSEIDDKDWQRLNQHIKEHTND